MKNRPSIRHAAWLLAGSALAPLSPALAQTAEATVLPELSVQSSLPDPRRPSPGIVAPTALSGSKTNTPLAEIPQSISVVTREAIDQRQAQSLGEALRYTPGVRGEVYGPDVRVDWLQLRGFDAQDNGLFLNGLRFNPAAAAGVFETWGLERYEVLRGPASVLYGQGSVGGLVNMLQRRPSETAQGEVRLTAGSYDFKQVAFTTSGPLSEDGAWSYSLSGLVRDAATVVDHTHNDRSFLAPAITWRPDADTRITLLAHYQRDQTNGSQFLPYSGTAGASAYGRIPVSRFSGEPDFDTYNRTTYALGYEAEHRLNETWTLRQNARFTHIDRFWNQVYGVAASGSTLARYAYHADTRWDSAQVDTQAEARFATGGIGHTLLGGLDYMSMSYKNVAQGAMGPSLDLYNPVYGGTIPTLPTITNQRQAIDQVGLYLQDQIRLGEHWIATLGLRQDFTSSVIKSRLGAGSRVSDDETATTWRAGLVYAAPNGLSPYASYTTSFMPQTGTDRSGATFRPLEGEQYEAGVKYQPPGLRSYAQLAAFHLTQRNSLTTDPNNSAYSVATGEIRVQGIEAEVQAQLGRGLNLTAAYTYQESEITEDNAGNEGNRPSGVPRHMASLYADYAFGDATVLDGLAVGGGVRFIGNTAVGNANIATLPSFTLFDASLRYDLSKLGDTFKGLGLAVSASNLADTRYVSRCGSLVSCFYGNGRTVLGSVSYRW